MNNDNKKYDAFQIVTLSIALSSIILSIIAIVLRLLPV
jgi:hypothetical protein